MNKYERLVDAILGASLDGIIALSELMEKPYVSSAYAALFPGWEKLRYNESLEIVRDFYSKYVANNDDLIDMIAEVRRTREIHGGILHFFRAGKKPSATGSQSRKLRIFSRNILSI